MGVRGGGGGGGGEGLINEEGGRWKVGSQEQGEKSELTAWVL